MVYASHLNLLCPILFVGELIISIMILVRAILKVVTALCLPHPSLVN